MRSVQLSATFSLLLFLCAGPAQAEVNREIYSPFQQILEQFLTKKDLSSIEGREESIAFWINAYNFLMLDQILTERPDGELVGSVWDYGGRVNPFVDSVFEREKFVIDGQEYSLSQMEKEILLGDEYADKGWKDARIHFAVNCASVGCPPPLRDTIYTADNLDDLLADNTRRAFNTGRHLMVEGDTLHVTEVFKWYEEDFNETSGSRIAAFAIGDYFAVTFTSATFSTVLSG